MVKKDSSGKIIPGDFFHHIKVLGIVEAGFPSPAEEELIDTMSLDEFLVRNKEATYMLKVSGDSMIEAGIMPDDIVLVERGIDAKDGDIVIAVVDDEWTIKYFRQKGKKVYLEPANKKYKPIYPKQTLEIAAVVKAIIRKY
jgi:repressor LexA